MSKIDEIMAQVQAAASAWALGLGDVRREKALLLSMLESALKGADAVPDLIASLRECLPYMVWTTEAGGEVHSDALALLHRVTGVDPIDYYTNGEQE